MRSRPILLVLLVLALARGASAGHPVPSPSLQGSGAAPGAAPAEAQQVELKTETPVPPSQTAQEWHQAVESLAQSIEAGSAETGEADALYDELDRVLRWVLATHRDVFRNAESLSIPLVVADGAKLDGQAPAGTASASPWLTGLVPPGATIGEFHTALVKLYAARLRLLEVVTPEYHTLLTGGGVVGVKQAGLERQYVERSSRYQRVAIPAALGEVGQRARAAPAPVVIAILSLIGSLIVFRMWRKWAKDGIPHLRSLTRGAWQGHSAARSIGVFLQYVESVRRPVEWFLLFAVVLAVIDFPLLHVIVVTLRIVVFSVLFVWFLVALANAVTIRTRGFREEHNLPRRRSFWILGAWVLVLGLGTRVAQHLAGDGTLKAWVWDLFWFLAIPVGISLLLVWRSTVREHLAREARFSPRAARLLERRGPFSSLVATVAGMLYVGFSSLRRGFLRLARRSPLGRTLVAEALVQNMSHVGEANAETGEPQELGADLRKLWLRGESLVETAIADALDVLRDRLERGWKTILLVGPRGGGKSVLLKYLTEATDLGALVVSCPYGDAEQAYAALVRALGIVEPDPTPAQVTESVKAKGVHILAWDDVHRLCRPVLGGQRELDRLFAMLEPLEGVQIVASVDSAAAEYLGRLREESVSGASTIFLSAWTEAQIGELIECRAREAGMELDFTGLHFPRMLLEQDFDSPEEGLRASYRRILWAESDGNPAVALRLVVEQMVQTESGDAVMRLPRSYASSEVLAMTLVEWMTLRFLVQTDGATESELADGLRYGPDVIKSAISTAEMRGLLEENHGRYRIAWDWYRTITRALARRNMLSAARQKSERDSDNTRSVVEYRPAGSGRW